jgi:phosphotransferase system enzyme I (PtsP)
MDVPQLAATNAVGIGLYRTEIPFMISHEYPDVRARPRSIARCWTARATGRSSSRTLDIGSDKVLP